VRTKNEKVLLAILAAIVFVSGNVFSYRWLAQKQSSLQLAYAQLRADQAEAKIDLQESDLWAQRKAWVSDHEPPLGDEGDAKAQVLEYVLKGARVNVSVKVKGPMQGLCKWLTDLQKPDQFYAISSFSLKADQDLKSMVCTLQIARYFKNK